jgi:predicted CopG family antitoxin
MAHKTITISEGAYEALARSKKENESFTKVILRLTSKSGRASSLLEHLRGSAADAELAGSIERAMRRTRRAQLTSVDLSHR